MMPLPPVSTLFPYTTLFRSIVLAELHQLAQRRDHVLALVAARTIDARILLHLRRRQRRIGLLGERSEEHTSELQSLRHLVCRLLLEKKKKNTCTAATHQPTQ